MILELCGCLYSNVVVRCLQGFVDHLSSKSKN
jgi:hypothetical protein